MATLLKKRVAKYTFDISANITEAATYGSFLAADILETPDTITIEGHKYKTGDMVACIPDTGVTAPTVPAIKTAYWVIVVDSDTIALATSLANAQAGTKAALNKTAQNGKCFLVKNAFGTITTDIVLPAGSIITDSYLEVITTFVGDAVIGGSTDDTTIALSTGVGAGDVTAAIAISDATNVWDEGVHCTLVGTPILGADAAHDTALELAALRAAKIIRVTTACNPTIAVAVNTLIAGKFDWYIEYAA